MAGIYSATTSTIAALSSIVTIAVADSMSDALGIHIVEESENVHNVKEIETVTTTAIGAGLPLMVKRFGGDPAVAASPAITTVVYITGMLLYFGMATLFFSL